MPSPALAKPPTLELALRRWTAFFSLPFALVLDARGIPYHFHLNISIPWRHIASASLEHGDSASLVLVLRDTLARHLGPSWSFELSCTMFDMHHFSRPIAAARAARARRSLPCPAREVEMVKM